MTRPNGINTNYSYDSLSRLLSVLHQAGSTTLDGASYTYDNAGNRATKTNYLNGITEGYTYDLIYQLTQVTQGASTTESYTYDAVGNRLSSSSVPSYNYNASNELTSSSNGSYTYDANGNTLTDSSGKQYSWDFENHLTQVVNPGVGTTTFRYDPFGRRIQKSGPLGTTIYLYDGFDASANVVEEVDSSGVVLARHTQGTTLDEPLAELRGSTASYYEPDGLGSISSLSDSAGTLVGTYTYDSFGKLVASTGTLLNPFRYTAREFDPETGMYYYRARYYDSLAGRFVSEDPIRVKGGMNFYAYVKNRPAIAKDPSGLAIYICSRQAFHTDAPFNTGPNHAFLYDTRNGDNCGMLNPPRSESLPNPNIVCTEVPGSDGFEDSVMGCCHKKAASKVWSWSTWRPGWHDCHNMPDECLKANGLANPGAPGGRMGCRGKCTDRSPWEGIF